MKKIIAVYAALVVLVLTGVALAQEGLVISTGVDGGTYSKFFNEILRVCPQPPITEWRQPKTNTPASGSVMSLDNLLSNTANVAFMQMDVMYAKRFIDDVTDVDNLKTLMVLYPESVHILTKNNGFVNNFSNLGNKKVGSWGGSTITARVLFAKTGVRPFQLREYPDKDSALKALYQDKDSLDAIIAVGGQPLGWLKDLNPQQYRLVPFDRTDQSVADVYRPATLNYGNLGGAVKSISTDSSLVTRDYKSKGKVADLVALRRCIVENLDMLRETTGNHPMWEKVNPNDHGKWPFYEPAITEIKKPAAPAAPAKKK
jgi:TRAP-type uncharacterized transport system substrate-binding protein